MRFPSESPAVDNDSAKRRAVPAHEFRQRMHDDVCTVVDWFQQDRRRNRVVDDEGNAMLMGDACEFIDVANVSGWIAHAFAKDCFRSFIDQLLDRIGLIRFRKSNIDPLAW